MSKFLLGGAVLTMGVLGCADTTDTSSTDQALGRNESSIRNDKEFRNPTGYAATFDTDGDRVDLTGDFFTSFGTNGRTCFSCHQPNDGWTIIPEDIQQRFNDTNGLDPLFSLVDGATSQNADVSTEKKRRVAYSMLLNKGLIRIGLAIPATAEFSLSAVDDPYHFASAAQLSLFRRPLQSANLFFLSTVMWDGRETLTDTFTGAFPAPLVPTHSDSNCFHPPFAAKCFRSLSFDLNDQAIQATLGHAQAMVPGLTPQQDAAIVEFETGLMFAQIRDDRAGRLNRRGALGGPDNIPSFPGYFGINDNFGDFRTGQPFTSTIFTLYDAWTDLHGNGYGEDYDDNDQREARESVARGQALFNTKQITISGVGGLNGSFGLPASFVGTCGTCHDTPEGGNHSVPAPLNIGVADASLRTADLPLYTLECNSVGIAAGHCTAGQTVQTTDPGRALITSLWSDIGRFKGPTLRGIAARAPYFHNGSAADFSAVIDFYVTRFGIVFTNQERRDLIAFLGTL